MQTSDWIYYINNNMFLHHNFILDYESSILSNNRSYDMLHFLLENIHKIHNFDFSTLDHIIRLLLTHNHVTTCIYFIQTCFTKNICTYNTIYKTNNIYQWKNEKCNISKYIALNLQELIHITQNINCQQHIKYDFQTFLTSFV